MRDFKKKARDIISKLTLEEKVSQMLHASKSIERFGICSYNWWNEALHGVGRSGTATVFPQAIALAATFDPELVEKTADIISSEARAKFNAYRKRGDADMYKGITFWSPNINIFRDPRWGRGQETYGEDPYLTSLIGAAFIKGLQGKQYPYLKTAACVKHFAVHSGPENDRHHFNAVVDKYDLWNTYLPAFEYAVKEAGVAGVMGAYNRLYGQPCCCSKFLLKDILRDKWGFSGYVVSDYNAVKNIYENHKEAKDAKSSVSLAVNNGCDIEAGDLFCLAADAVKEGLIDEKRVDEAVERLFVTRMRLDILDGCGESEYDRVPYEIVDCSEHAAFNLEAARRSIVLLKNNGTLPLNASKIKSIGVIGPNADNRRALEGNYNGTAGRYVTVLEGIRDIAEKDGVRVLFAEGCHMYKEAKEDLAKKDDRIAEACSVAENCDVSMVCLGLDGDFEGEEDETPGKILFRGDKNRIELPDTQQRLLKKVIEASKGKPVIAVIISGSAVSFGFCEAEKLDGIFQCFYPGALGGMAVAEAVFGKFSPSGKLPVTFYRRTEDLPPFDDYCMDNRTYRYFKGDVLYPFGFGLGYSSFKLDNFRAYKEYCLIDAENTGTFDAGETLQVYAVSPGQKEIMCLCGLQNIYLKRGEKKEIRIALNERAFSRYDEEGNSYIIKGLHTLYAGFTQPDKRSLELSGQPAISIALDIRE